MASSSSFFLPFLLSVSPPPQSQSFPVSESIGNKGTLSPANSETTLTCNIWFLFSQKFCLSSCRLLSFAIIHAASILQRDSPLFSLCFSLSSVETYTRHDNVCILSHMRVVYLRLSSVNYLNEEGRPEVTSFAYHLSPPLSHQCYDPFA